MLAVGDRAPEFRARDQDGSELTLAELTRDGPLVLYFYPKDFTRGCTKEACLFRDSHAEMRKLDAQVVGVSIDDEKSHKGFAEKHGLQFRLLADPDRTVSKAYDVLQPFGIFTKRVTYVIDREQRIRGVFHHELAVGKHVDRVRQLLHELKSGA
jgi:peroxiredoxin Q/BCP